MNQKIPLRLLCLLAVCLVSTGSNAEDKVNKELTHEECAEQFLQAYRWETMAEQELQRAISGMRKSGLPDEFIGKFEEHASASDLAELLVPSVVEQYSSEELLSFAEFFRTSGGSKVVTILQSRPEGDPFEALTDALVEGEAEPVAAFLGSPLGDALVAGQKAMFEDFREIAKRYVFGLANELDPRVQGEKRRP